MLRFIATIVVSWLTTTVLFSQSKIDSLLTQLPNSAGKERVSVLSALCSEYAYINADSARLFGIEALQLVGTEPTGIRAQILYGIAITHQVQSNYDEALKYNEEGLTIYKSLNDSLRIADLLNNIGLIYDEQGNYSQAAKYYQSALVIYKRRGDFKKMALVNVNLGVVYKALGDYKSSINNYLEALNEFKKISDDYLMAVCHVNLGSVYLYYQAFDSALHHSLKAETMFGKLNYKRFETVAVGNIGIAYGKLKNYQLAIRYLQSAIKQHEENSALKELSFCQLKLAEVYAAMQRNADAIAMAMKALPLSERANALQQATDINLLLSRLYQKTGDYEQAYRFQSDYLAGHDSLFQNDRLKQVRELQVQYETERKERELAESKVVLAENALEIKKRDNQLILALSGILVLLLLTFIIYRNSQVKQQKLSLKAELTEVKALTALQEERLRISRELHDNIGSQLTFINSSVSGLAKKLPPGEVTEVQKITLDTIRELRKTVWLINKPGIQLDEFVVKLREYLQQDTQGSIVLSSKLDNELSLSSQQATHLFRIVQEATNNAIKYAHASLISVDIHCQSDRLVCTITDNGKGFDFNNVKEGFGLQTMRDRAKALHAEITVSSTIGEGTSIQLSMPVEYDEMRMDKTLRA